MTHTTVVLLIVVLSLVDLGRASYLVDTETGDRREAGADQQQVDALVEYLMKRIQREQEFPSYSGSLVLKIKFPLSLLYYGLSGEAETDSKVWRPEESIAIQ